LQLKNGAGMDAQYDIVRTGNPDLDHVPVGISHFDL